MPDKERRVQESSRQHKDEIDHKALTRDSENTLVSHSSPSNKKTSSIKKSHLIKEFSENPNDLLYSTPNTSRLKSRKGKQALIARENEFTEIVNELNVLLESYPSEDEKAQEINYLNVPLYPFQQYGVLFMLWREAQVPSGGILADDSDDLGKICSMLTLIIAMKNESDLDIENKNKNESSFSRGGTLILCYTSFKSSHWENEALNRCKHDPLSVVVYKFNIKQQNLEFEKYDVVVTTHSMLCSEFKKENSPFFKVCY